MAAVKKLETKEKVSDAGSGAGPKPFHRLTLSSMASGRCLGLVGGLGVGATIHYYRKLAEAHEAQGRSLNIVIANAETSRVFAHVQKTDRDGLAEYLIGFIQRLQAAGATLAAIPAVTPYYCARELTAASPIPVIDIFQPLIDELARKQIRRVSVFGTRFVIESDLFGFVKDVEIVHAMPAEVDTIHQVYVELARRGEGSPEERQAITDLAKALVKREQLDAIVLAGTDFSSIFSDSNPDFPAVDCAELHIRTIVHRLLAA